MLLKKLTVFLIILSGIFCYKRAHAQLWSYIGWTPAKEKAFEKRLKKEAYKVITHHTPDEDKFPYDEMIYRMFSLDSSVCYVHIMQVPFTKTLTISTSNDSLKISDCVGTAHLHMMRRDLFEIVYSPRGGSDDGFDNALLLAIKNGKFRIAFQAQTMHDYDGPGFFGLDETHLMLTGEKPNYHLTIKNHDLRRYDKKSNNFDHYHTYTLKYDRKLNIFYSSYTPVSGDVYDDYDSGKKHHINGIFPIVKLGDDEYCYMNDCWYTIYTDPKTKKISLALI